MDGYPMNFDELWKFSTRYGQIQQEKSELEHAYNLIKNCKSYLEVGTAEGGSLNVLADSKRYAFVDMDEDHTRKQKNEVIARLSNGKAIHGNSHDHLVIERARKEGPYDCVFIDAGHSYEDVLSDAIAYGGMATRYLLFHDVQLPDVKRAFLWYVRQQNYKKVHFFINSETYGYGIIEL